MELGRPRSSIEEKAHRTTKQQRTIHALSRGSEKGNVQLLDPQAWLPALMLGGEPLTDDASIRDYNEGIGCHVALVLEETSYSPEIWWSYEDLGGMKSSFKLNDFWAWYVFIFSQSFLSFYLIQHSFFSFFFFKRLFKALSE